LCLESGSRVKYLHLYNGGTPKTGTFARLSCAHVSVDADHYALDQ